MKNKNLINTIIYIYIILLAFAILYYIYNNLNNNTNETFNAVTTNTINNEDAYRTIVGQYLVNAEDWIQENENKKLEILETNNNNKKIITELIKNSGNKLNTIITNFINSI